jgi:hemolysin activation/secretion protein
LGASLANLLYARDEGFYYRSSGAELGGSREGSGPLGGATLLWRMFAERQRTAGREPNTQASLGHAFGRARFTSNVEAVSLTALGAGGDLARSFGADPTGVRVDTRVRAEAAFTDRADPVGRSGYGRLVLDGTLARPLGPLAVALTGAAGASAGDLPAQRAFHVGGLHTVRGQFARAEGPGRVGDAFWLARGEIGLAMPVARPALFYDVGWAGPRGALPHPGRPLSGVGAGLSLLDGLVRLDVARGIWPERRWRTDLSIGARF